MAEAYRSFAFTNEDEDTTSSLSSTASALTNTSKQHHAEEYLPFIRRNIIGQYASFDGPYGPRPCIYADWY
jgi:hypothetical protein